MPLNWPDDAYHVEGLCRANRYRALPRFFGRRYGGSIRPAFKQQNGDDFQGHAGRSQDLAKEFISVNPREKPFLPADRVKW